MTITRQDAWTQDEDLLLAEVVLRHIRDGGTQLSAFEEVGKALSRTAAACGFRWNSYVRKQYQAGIELAKKQRKELRKKLGIHSSGLPSTAVTIEQAKEKDLTLRDVIQFLEQLENEPTGPSYLREELKETHSKLKALTEENESLKRQLKITEEDYRALIGIVERVKQNISLKEYAK
ncbi:sporulation-specific transcriptional regulator GerR [Bacillus sp. NPDC077027]|uniref:sporulation-specific transcriptional regulator GerR n=1 Tax=Bacillus sp. NPDC077027 TaxID=3390548 RepID=UPI003D0142E8